MPEKRRDSKGRILRKGESQRADGKYMFRYVDSGKVRRTIYSWKLVATDRVPDGKKCSMSLRELEDSVSKDMLDNVDGNLAKKITLNQLFEEYITLRTDLRPTTRNNYRCTYNSHVRDTLGEYKIGAIKYSDVRKMYLDMLKESHLKIGTVKNVNALVYQTLELAVKDDLIRKNPARNALKGVREQTGEEPDKRHALTIEEQSNLIEYVKSSDRFSRWMPLITVLLGTGLRIGEALGLRWCDCDFKNSIITVNHIITHRPSESGKYEYHISKPKTISSIREIPMFNDVKDALVLLRKQSIKERKPRFEVDGYTDFIFTNSNGRVFPPTNVYEALHDIVNTYNKEEYLAAKSEGRDPAPLPSISAHIFRHTFCTRLCENENNIKVIQDVMGHKDSRTTINIYSDATREKKMESFKYLEGKIRLA